MTRIALVVSDVDGTLLTKNKTLTDDAKSAVRKLREAGIGFTITSSRPTIGMRFLIEPLAINAAGRGFQRKRDCRPATEPDRTAPDPSSHRAAQSRNIRRVRDRYLAVHQPSVAHA
jgi:phosphoglycolate phosphatase-like HAD superfamily hydrolase